jgi:hypothetical protein
MITKCAVFIVAFGLSAFIGGWALAQSWPRCCLRMGFHRGADTESMDSWRRFYIHIPIIEWCN